MKALSLPAGVDDYDRVAHAIGFIRARRARQPSLGEVAAAVGLSEFHFQRLFSRWAGISPKRFLQVLTVDHAKALLTRSADLLSTSLDAGLSGPGRLHDLFVQLEAMTPGEFKAGGSGLILSFGVHPSPLGSCLIALTARGICGLEFIDGPQGRSNALARLRHTWPGARLVEDPDATASMIDRIFGSAGPTHAGSMNNSVGRASPNAPSFRQTLSVIVRGTNFQVQVWRALLSVPPGAAISYAGLARLTGRPRAVRAAASAVGANPVAYLIPCHRILRSDGGLGGYRWGEIRKAAALVLDGVDADQVDGGNGMDTGR